MSTAGKGLGGEWQKLTREARRVFPPVCWVCKGHIDVTLPKTDAMSWTLDHLDARSVHGTDVPTLDRTRPAHRRCNSRRGARPAATRRWML